ncbi:hypothetical protein ACFL2H_13140 [Planctomycetota bacterium]
MDDPQSPEENPDENPFSAPEGDTGLPPIREISDRIHPLLLVPVVLASIIVGFCTFFCTCLGAIFIDSGAGVWVLWVCFILALAATIGVYQGIIILIRRRRRRDAMLARWNQDDDS